MSNYVPLDPLVKHAALATPSAVARPPAVYERDIQFGVASANKCLYRKRVVTLLCNAITIENYTIAVVEVAR